MVVDVVVWGSTSLLTQVTVVPTGTDAGFGTKAVVVSKVAPRGIEIVTDVGLGVGVGAGVGVGVGVGVAGGVDGLLLLQPATKVAETISATASRANCIGFVSERSVTWHCFRLGALLLEDQLTSDFAARIHTGVHVDVRIAAEDRLKHVVG